MIAKLSGVVDSTGDGWAVIDVGGVGYLVFCSGRTLSRLAGGQIVSLRVETAVRDDAITLYGFGEAAERQWFRLLTTVQGIGAKAALSILTALSPDDLARAIAAGDRGAITRAAGVGAKLAGRVIGELRDKVDIAAVTQRPAVPSFGAAGPGGDVGDAVSALVNLGFRPSEALLAVAHAQARLGTGAQIEELIRGGLAELTPGEARP
ncbi:MAG: Holliday junction branch migration protein RuvA [Rhodospirillales bacterium]